jgi:hypothetical protein
MSEKSLPTRTFLSYRSSHIVQLPVISQSSHVDGECVFHNSQGLESNVQDISCEEFDIVKYVKYGDDILFVGT